MHTTDVAAFATMSVDPTVMEFLRPFPGILTPSSIEISRPTRRWAFTRGRITPDKVPLAVRHIPRFLRAHRPVPAAQSMVRCCT